MRRCLLLVYDALPGAPVGSALRTDRFARWLPEFGWEPSVLCARGGAGESVQRVDPPLTWLGSVQLSEWAWAMRVRRPAAEVLRRGSYDLVYVSCPPHPAALTALSLARRSGLPLVVDLRDSWSFDPHGSGGVAKRALKSLLCKTLYQWCESRVFAGAGVLLANTPSMQRAYARRYRLDLNRFPVLPNGFDEEDFEEPDPPPRPGPPTVVHCGRFSAVGGRSPRSLMLAVARVQRSGRAVRLRLVGDEDPGIRSLGDKIGLQGLEQVATVSHAKAIEETRRADVVVVYQEHGEGPVTPIAGKTYEALRSGRPLLALVPEGDNAGCIREYAAVAEIADPRDAEAAARALGRLLDRPGLRAPSAEYSARHSRRHLTRELAGHFDRLVASRGQVRGVREPGPG